MSGEEVMPFREVGRSCFNLNTYLRVSLVLQVEQEKQLTHQALFSADTTEKEFFFYINNH